MASLVGYMANTVGAGFKQTLIEMAGVRSHNICDPFLWTSNIVNPEVPLCMAFPDETLQVGTLISITASLNSSFSKRFRIDFIMRSCEHRRAPELEKSPVDRSDQYSIGFHFNARFGGGNQEENFGDVVVMNSRLDGQWGEEQRDTRFPFKLNVPFRMMILIKEESFNIAVDDQHIYEFKHRANLHEIGRMHIEGNINIGQIEIRKELKYMTKTYEKSSGMPLVDEQGDQQPAPASAKSRPEPEVKLFTSPPLPLSEYDGRLTSPSYIYMAGMLPTHTDRNFVINLASSNFATKKSIPVHISVRPVSQSIVRNSMIDGEFGGEELELATPDFPFTRGTHFDLVLCNLKDRVSMVVNGQLAFEYKHRLDSKLIDTVEVNGDVQLTSLRFEFPPPAN